MSLCKALRYTGPTGIHSCHPRTHATVPLTVPRHLAYLRTLSIELLASCRTISYLSTLVVSKQTRRASTNQSSPTPHPKTLFLFFEIDIPLLPYLTRPNSITPSGSIPTRDFLCVQLTSHSTISDCDTCSTHFTSGYEHLLPHTTSITRARTSPCLQQVQACQPGFLVGAGQFTLGEERYGL